MLRILPFFLVVIVAVAFYPRFDDKNNDDWADYLGGPDRNHYSALNQIDTTNINQLKVAWSYSAPDTGQMQMHPIIVKGVL